MINFIIGALFGALAMRCMPDRRAELLDSCRTYICGNCKTARRYDNYVVRCNKCVFKELKKYRKDDAE